MRTLHLFLSSFSWCIFISSLYLVVQWWFAWLLERTPHSLPPVKSETKLWDVGSFFFALKDLTALQEAGEWNWKDKTPKLYLRDRVAKVIQRTEARNQGCISLIYEIPPSNPCLNCRASMDCLSSTYHSFPRSHYSQKRWAFLSFTVICSF